MNAMPKKSESVSGGQCEQQREKNQKECQRNHIREQNSIKCIHHMPITHSHVRVLIEK